MQNRVNKMLLLDDAIYEETKKLTLGKSKRSPMLMEFSVWFLERFSAKVLNIEFSKLIYPKATRHRLYVILENSEDYQKMYDEIFKPKEDYQKQIASEFQRIALKYKFATQEQLENLFVTYNDFSEEAKTQANWQALREVRQVIKEKYATVWEVISPFSNSVVFYYADSDILLNENNGINKSIANDYYSILKKYDELSYFTRENIILKFDSKENLYKNYEGNLSYYQR
jgi:hypothetical protein